MSDLINGLNAYVAYLQQHPNLDRVADISHYNVKHDEIAELLASGATLNTLNTADSIAYVDLKFGDLRVRYVVKKSEVMTPAIENGDVVWTLKPEFAGELAVAQ
jgi:hypothetical protein